MSNTLLRNAIQNSLRTYGAVGVSLAFSCAASPALAQDSGAKDQKGQALDTIVVTGSNIRRVDIETANPVITIDHAAIQQSGKLTLGDLIQQLPMMAGASTNPNVNNGGGNGASTISLRGLGTSRSLLLINGHRIPSQLQDLNIIPASAVERIEVLTDGSSAVYGSDAVAGVVNIITSTNYQGAEFGADYGISDHDDGERTGYHAIFGQTTEKGNIILGINYNKQDAVSAANRVFSHDALYRYNTGFVLHGGSSRTPNGSISLPGGNYDPNTGNLINYTPGSPAALYGCVAPGTTGSDRVTRIAGANGTTTNDYRCYQSTDAFNYQAVGNYDLTNTERTGFFALGNYKLTDSVESFMEIFHNKTVSNSQIAPVPTDALADGIYIPATAYYNPFGVDFGIAPDGSPTNQFRTRLSSIGDRGTAFSSTHDLITTGFKGAFGDSTWNWNADFSYGHLSQQIQNVDFIDYSKLAENFACPTAPGAGSCTPINIFNIDDPNTIALLDSAKISPTNHLIYQSKTEEAGVTGTLFDLPAGAVQLAAGASYRKEYTNFQPDPLITTTVDSSLNVTCSGPSSICSAPTQGGFSVKESYAELLVPLLKDVPFAHSLNLDIGDRYSKYSNFGSTNNWKFALEYRPIEDLLLRATVSKVFRAPTVTDLYLGPAGEAPVARDPCGLAAVASNPACQGYTFVNTGTAQINGIVTGQTWATQNIGSTVNIQPEFGKSYDYGFVYDPSWLSGLSVNADLYRILLNDLIVSGAGTAQTILTQCFNNGGPTCSLISRYNSGSNIGQIKNVFEAPFNSGTLTTNGVDVGAHYRLPETSVGNFRISLAATYINEYNIDQGGFDQHYAGHYDKTYGNLARWRALSALDWNLGSFNVNWTTRYVGPVVIGYTEPGLGPSASADGLYTPVGASVYHYGAYVYNNISAGYNIEQINTQVQVGVDNVTDKQPPIFYQNNVVNANTDVTTYDTIGRFYWARLTVKF
jgi:iron complex outermembrane recepter protein